jgi:simple sugar transport system permease protein
MAQQTEGVLLNDDALLTGKKSDIGQRIKQFLLNNGPLLTTIVIFILLYLVGGWLYPAMQKPQVFFNLFINQASLLLVSIGMTRVILSK